MEEKRPKKEQNRRPFLFSFARVRAKSQDKGQGGGDLKMRAVPFCSEISIVCFGGATNRKRATRGRDVVIGTKRSF
jgi:hypothetical protein